MQKITRKLSVWAGVVTILLMAPLAAMRFHFKVYDPGSGFEEVAWTLRDFISAAILLYGSGFAYIMATRNISNSKRRFAVGVIVFFALAFIWVAAATGFEGAVDAVKNQ